MVKRYEPDYYDERMREDLDGGYVRQEDYNTLESKYAALLEEKMKALDGTGHATLAEMRAEFDAMMEEVNVSRRYVDRLWKDLDNVAVPRPPYYPGLTRDYTEAKEATDAARPKEPT